MISDGRVRTDFGFSFDAAPTIDAVLYFRVETKEDGVGWRKMELDGGRRSWTEEDRVDLIDTSSSRTS